MNKSLKKVLQPWMFRFMCGTTLLLPLIITNTAKAELYFGVNAGAAVVTVAKTLDYNQTSADIFSNYMGLRIQSLIGFNFYTFDKGIFTQPLDKETIQHKWFFAAELAGNYNTGNATSSINPWFLTTNASTEEQQDFSLDLFFLGKYRSTPNTVWFFGPGFSRGNFKVSSSKTAGSLGYSGSNKSSLMGWSLKAGVELPFYNLVKIVLTYQLTQFNNVSLSAVEPLTGDNVTTKYKPMVNAFTIGVNFNSWSDLFKDNSYPVDSFPQAVIVKKEICMDVYCEEDKIVRPKTTLKRIKIVEKPSMPRKEAIKKSKKHQMYAEAFPDSPLENNIFSFPHEDPIPVIES